MLQSFYSNFFFKYILLWKLIYITKQLEIWNYEYTLIYYTFEKGTM